jgi:hypothetical protein
MLFPYLFSLFSQFEKAGHAIHTLLTSTHSASEWSTAFSRRSIAMKVPVRPTPAEQCVKIVALGAAEVAARTTFLQWREWRQG